jgi:hypothetical protein
METVEMTKVKKSASKKKSEREMLPVRDGIKPRGGWGMMKGKIHYDENEDIFNLSL